MAEKYVAYLHTGRKMNLLVYCLSTQVQLQSSDEEFRLLLLSNLCIIAEDTKKSRLKIDFCLFKFRREGFVFVA